jgi:predicted SAM-dependent methyltransferase
MKKYLNLGCGNDTKISGTDIEWINIDFISDNQKILNMDLREPLPFIGNSIDFIFTSHLIEHFTKYEWASIKKDWYRVLAWGGTLEIHCPDLETVCKLFLKGENKYIGIVPIHDMIYGSQEIIGQMHHQGFDKERICKDLEYEGFKIIKCFNSTSIDDWELTCIAKKE